MIYPCPCAIKHTKLNPYQNVGMLVIIYFQSLARRLKQSVLEMHEMLNIYLLIEYDYFTKLSENYLKRKGPTYDLWLHEMSLEKSHCDELALLALAQMCNYHIMVYAKSMNWTMLNVPSEGITHAELLAKCDLHLVYMGHNLFAELVKWTIRLMVTDQIVDYKLKLNIKECSIKLCNLMSLTLYTNKDSITDSSPNGHKSDNYTSSDTIIYELPLQDENMCLYRQIIEVNEIITQSKSDRLKLLNKKKPSESFKPDPNQHMLVNGHHIPTKDRQSRAPS